MKGQSGRPQAGLWSEPSASAMLEVLADGGRRAFDAGRRRELREQLAAGTLDEIVFEARTFRARYPNYNFVRFRDEHLVDFAASFVNQPFLRDHNGREIAARAGIVRASSYDEAERKFVQEIALTVPRDMQAFVDGQIDRFSISWHWTDPVCSVCGQQWLSRDCRHWPGGRYPAGEGKQPVLCELIFLEPRGREVSAVNVPAVAGTGIEQVLSELCAAKQELQEGSMDGADGVDKETRRQGDGVDRVDTETRRQGDGVDRVDTVDKGAHGARKQGGGMDALDQVDKESRGVGPMADVGPWIAATRDVLLDSRLKGSGLPSHFQEDIRVRLGADWDVKTLDQAVASARSLWAKLEADRTVQGVGAPHDGRVRGMLDSQDKITEALTALIEGRSPGQGIRPLSGFREAYIALTGDWDLHGMFHPERVSLAVDSSTMAGIVANAMNKVVVNEFQRYPQWWKPIMKVESFTTLQQVKWITVGGIGELPEVPEGGAYDELTWDDQTETSEWSKRGGYVGITLEAIDRDDVGKLRTAPRAMAQAAWLTLGKKIAGIFTVNGGVGKTMSDGKALFHTDHGNLGTTALSAAAVGTVKAAMRKQSELNSGERLGALTAPRFLLTPGDLENVALTALASENMPGTANNDVNPDALGDTHEARLAAARRRLVVVDFWTDTNDWAMVADPDMYPTLGLGYRFGETPEVFSVATPSQTAGLMFTNDQLPVKVRFFFATGAMDWRGLYKMNVA